MHDHTSMITYNMGQNADLVDFISSLAMMDKMHTDISDLFCAALQTDKLFGVDDRHDFQCGVPAMS